MTNQSETGSKGQTLNLIASPSGNVFDLNEGECGEWFCRCPNPEKAKLIISRLNLFPELVEALTEARKLMSNTLHSIAYTVYEDEKKAVQSVKDNPHIKKIDAILSKINEASNL